MSNESTYGSISAFVASIYEQTLFVAREQAVLPGLVRVFSDSQSLTPRVATQYTGGTIQTLSETTDMSAQTFTPGSISALNPGIVGAQYYLTDARLSSDWNQARDDASNDLGQIMGVKMDTDLAGTFSSLTGGTVGTAGGTIAWKDIFKAQTLLRQNAVPGPYVCVLQPGQWYFLGTVVAFGASQSNAPGAQDRLAAGPFFQGSYYGIDFYVDANITSGTAAVGALFGRDALGLDIRRAMRIEPQRDASRGGGGWELNLTAVYGYGVWRPTWGAKITATSVVP